MFSLSRCVLRWGLIGAAGLGALAFIAGPDRIAAGFDQIRSNVRDMADEFVEDPVALRRQLAGLAEKYPERIAEVRAEIAEVDRQRARLVEDQEIARRVVSLTSTDLAELRLALRDAESGEITGRRVAIQVSGRSFDVAGARSEARRIHGIRSTYEDRLATDSSQIEFLGTQRERLSEILAKLENEHGRYQAKLWQLDQQIDAIARNDRLIEMTKEQQAILAEYDKFDEVGSLDQLESKLAELRTIQEAQLQTLAARSGHEDYEQAARESVRGADWNWDSEWDIDLDLDGARDDDGSGRDSIRPIPDGSVALGEHDRN